MKHLELGLAISLLLAPLPVKSASAATVEVVNADPDGVGFNDPTEAAAVPGNGATTVGAQKLAVVEWAADKLGELLYSPVPIVVEVSHDDGLFCGENSATLAAAGPAWLMRLDKQVADHPDLPTWFPSALTHRLTGTQLFSEDVNAVFNPDLGETGCMAGLNWYLGLDNDPPPGTLPFVDTVMHELTHGLGFTSLADENGLISELDPTSISPYFAYAFDGATQKFWWEMTTEERAASSTNGLLVWAGPQTTQAAASLVTAPLDGDGHVYMYAPPTFNDGSSVSHFEESTSPDLLMEPFASSNLDVQSNDIDLALEFLHDIGWRDPGCGNGIVDDGEQCDHGDANGVAQDSPDDCTSQCEWFVLDECPEDANKTEPGICGCGVADDDTDSDGTEDCIDECPQDATKTAAGVCGCGVSDTDTDSDGTLDCNDVCPSDPNKIVLGVCGCGLSDVDTDEDQTADCLDDCSEDPNKIAPGVCGCGTADLDSDGDGAADCIDECPEDGLKTQPGVCGCGSSDVDTDGDLVADCIDQCPQDRQKTEPLVCGCGVSETDRDGDLTLDCQDACPSDASKTSPGTCGCGVADDDRDADGTADCRDQCPDSAIKTSPGACGCHEVDEDSDSDGRMDCNDECPSNPNKTEAGVCGCSAPDTDTDGDGSFDCLDVCPEDPNKADPGICGCGVRDQDADNDGTLDCQEACPGDTRKVNPGICGCGVSDDDSDRDGAADCLDECPLDPSKREPGDCGCGVADTDSDRDMVPDCDDGCPSEPGLPSNDGCPPEDVPDEVGDAGAPKDPPGILVGDGGVVLLPDGGTWSRDDLEALLGDSGLTPEEINERLLQQLLDELTADGGARVDLNLGLPDECQCSVPGRRVPTKPWALGLILAGAAAAWYRRQNHLTH